MITLKKSIEQGFSGNPDGLYDVLTELQTEITAIKTPFANVVCDASIVVGAEDTNVINVAIQLKDYLGADLAVPSYIKAYCCTTAAATTKETTTVSTETAIGTDGEILIVTAKTEYMLLSEADGDIDLNFTDTGTNSFYFALVMPTGKLVVSDVITFTT